METNIVQLARVLQPVLEAIEANEYVREAKLYLQDKDSSILVTPKSIRAMPRFRPGTGKMKVGTSLSVEGYMEIVWNGKDAPEEAKEYVLRFKNTVDAVVDMFIDVRKTKKSEKILKKISKISESFMMTGTWKDILRSVLSTAMDTIEAEAASLILYDEQEDAMYFEIALGPTGETIEKRKLPKGRGIYWRAFSTGMPVYVPDVTKDPSWFGDVSGGKFKTVSILAYPLSVRDKKTGVIEFLNKATHPKKIFTEEDLMIGQVVSGHVALAIENAKLYRHLDNLYMSLVRVLVTGIESKDPVSRGHSARVGVLSKIIGEKLGLPYQSIKELSLAALLHDIGKIKIPENTLINLSKGQASPSEIEQYKKHPAYAVDILGKEGELGKLAEIISQHHERWDGEGFPNGIRGNSIHPLAQIIHLADAVDRYALGLASKADSPGRLLEYVLTYVNYEEGKTFSPWAVNGFKVAYYSGELEGVFANFYMRQGGHTPK